LLYYYIVYIGTNILKIILYIQIVSKSSRVFLQKTLEELKMGRIETYDPKNIAI